MSRKPAFLAMAAGSGVPNFDLAEAALRAADSRGGRLHVIPVPYTAVPYGKVPIVAWVLEF